MTDLIQKNKLITKLIKIISDKESIIQTLKRSIKTQEKQLKATTEIKMVAFDEKIKEDITANTLEVKLVRERLQFVERKMEQMTQLLNEEISINSIYEEKIKAYEKRQEQYAARIEQLSKKIQDQQKEKVQSCQKIDSLVFEKQKLIQKIEEFKVQQHYEKILEAKLESLTKSEVQSTKFEFKIGQSIDRLFDRFCRSSQKNVMKQHRATSKAHRREELVLRLEQIQLALKETNFHTHGDILNETLDGLSIIMQSLQQKLEEACNTDRNSQPADTSSEKSPNMRTLDSKGNNSSEKQFASDKSQKQKSQGSF